MARRPHRRSSSLPPDVLIEAASDPLTILYLSRRVPIPHRMRDATLPAVYGVVRGLLPADSWAHAEYTHAPVADPAIVAQVEAIHRSRWEKR